MVQEEQESSAVTPGEENKEKTRFTLLLPQFGHTISTFEVSCEEKRSSNFLLQSRHLNSNIGILDNSHGEIISIDIETLHFNLKNNR